MPATSQPNLPSSPPGAPSGWQFTSRTLLMAVTIWAASLAAARWLGPAVFSFTLAAVGIWLSFRTKGRHWFVWLLPSLWSWCAFGSWRHPGDEYGLFGVSVLVGLWVATVLKFGHLTQVYLWPIAAGALTMAILGLLMDRLRVPRRLWAMSYVVASAAILAQGLLSYPTLQRAIAKNGSISAYAYCAANLGMYLTVLLSLSGGVAVWLWRCCRVRQSR